MSAVPELEAQQKAHVGGGQERAARRGGRLRIPEPTPQPVFRVRLLVSLTASESGILREPERLPRGKLDRGRLHLGRRAEIPRGSDGARARRGAEFRARGKLKAAQRKLAF